MTRYNREVMKDIDDLQSQLVAIQGWLDEVRQRLVRDHAGLGAKDVASAHADINAALKKLIVLQRELEN